MLCDEVLLNAVASLAHRLERARAQSWGSRLESTGSSALGLSRGAPDSRAQAQQWWCMDLVALWHVGSSQTRDPTRVSCIGRQILYH